MQAEPMPKDSLVRTLSALGIVSSGPEAVLSHQETRNRLGRVLFLVGMGIFIITLSQPVLIGKFLFEPYLHRQGWFEGTASFWAITALFWYLKPLFALLVDHVPLLGSRRRLYLMTSAALAAVLWLTVLVAPHTASMMTAACIGIGAMLALGSTVVGGFLVEEGQKLGATGRLGALHQALLHFAALVGVPLSAVLAGSALHITPIVGAVMLLVLAAGSYLLMRDETPAPRARHTTSRALHWRSCAPWRVPERYGASRQSCFWFSVFPTSPPSLQNSKRRLGSPMDCETSWSLSVMQLR
jgi:MFS family permease